MKRLTILAFIVLLTSFAGNAMTWHMDLNYSSMTFSIPHLKVGKVNGQIPDFNIKMRARESDFRDVTMDLTINTNTITSYNTQRDNLMRSEKLFNVNKYPVMSFKSEWVETISEDMYNLHGDLTIRGITKPSVFRLEYKGTVYDPEIDKDTAVFILTAVIDRTEYGVELWQKDVMGNFIQIVANIEMLQ